MSEIHVDREYMNELFKKPERIENELNTAIAGFTGTIDGGIASDKLALVVRIALEGAQLAANAAFGVCEVSRAALDSQILDDSEIMDSLNNFTNKKFEK